MKVKLNRNKTVLHAYYLRDKARDISHKYTQLKIDYICKNFLT